MWGDYSQKDALTYPYKAVKKIAPTGRYDEMLFGRELHQILGSIAKFGRMVEVDSVVDLGGDMQKSESLSLVNRLCNGELHPRDIGYLVKCAAVDQPYVTTINLSTIRSLPSSRWRDEDNNWGKYTEIILYDMISRNKSVVFRLEVKQKNSRAQVNVDGYFLGDVSLHDIEPQRSKVQRLILLYFEEDTTTIKFNRRLHVPSAFCIDMNFMTYLFVFHLKEHGDYLQISGDYMLRMKLELPETIDVLELHDNYFGQLRLDDIEESHPFITTKYKGKDHLELLEEMGWRVVDVEGDGNCGFYVIILGLENMGIKEYYVDRRAKSPESTNESDEWIHKHYFLRRAMSNEEAFGVHADGNLSKG